MSIVVSFLYVDEKQRCQNMREFETLWDVDAEIADAIALVMESEKNIEKAKEIVATLTEKYPLQ